jgi:two-component system response regulator
MKMAGVDGVELLRRIRADERLKHLRVAIVTNSELDSDRDQATSAGADAFLHKGFDMDQFSSDMRMLLQQLSKK